MLENTKLLYDETWIRRKLAHWDDGHAGAGFLARDDAFASSLEEEAYGSRGRAASVELRRIRAQLKNMCQHTKLTVPALAEQLGIEPHELQCVLDGITGHMERSSFRHVVSAFDDELDARRKQYGTKRARLGRCR